METHDINHQIFGDDMQFVEVELDPGETVVGEAGAMMYMESDILFETKMGDGTSGKTGTWSKLKAAGKRAITGESIFMTHFTNQGSDKKHVSFAAEFPGKIIPLNLSEHSGEIICQADAFLCAAMGTEIDIAFQKKLGAGFFGGEGFILQRLKGNGQAFISVGGTVIEKELNGETLLVDTGCLVAFENTINYDIQRAGNLKSMFLGGEGLFLASMSGQGKVWLQSLPFSRLANRIISEIPRPPGSGDGPRFSLTG